MTNIAKFDHIYSLYIRLRDAGDGGYTRCISCGKVLPFEQMQCGHYYSRRHLATRWDERNCNSECIFCNEHDTNHLEGYTKNLIAKIGQAEFDKLTELHKTLGEPPTDEELPILLKGYRALCRTLAGYKGIPINI